MLESLCVYFHAYILVFYYQLDSETGDAYVAVINPEQGKNFIKKDSNSLLTSSFLNANW